MPIHNGLQSEHGAATGDSRTREKLQVILQLLSIPGMDAARIGGLFDRMAATGQSVDGLGGYTRPELGLHLGLSPEQAEAFLAARDRARAQVNRAPIDGVHLLTRADAGWPANLLKDHARRATPWLFVHGDPGIVSLPSVGLAGSRDATASSIEITRQLAGMLVRAGRVIVSGGARGVDRAAHDAALAAGGRTIVILAQGIGTYHVPSGWHAPIREGRLAIVSEYLPGDAWEPFRAIQRNATIVQLGQAFVVVQAGAPSGTLSAGQHALRMGWPLHVVTREGTNGEMFPGNNQLIRLGGRPLHISHADAVPESAVQQILIFQPSTNTSPAQLGLFT